MVKLRQVRFSPYRKGCGPRFTVTLWDTGAMRDASHCRLAYKLTMDGAIIFSGDDFGPSPLDAIDSDDCVKSLMSFLTLQPGDTDAEYFQDYTPAQLEYCAQHAEALAMAVIARFGE